MSSAFNYYSQTAALGPPDAKGLYPQSPWRFESWAPSSKDGTIEYLTVDFLEPVYATGVAVRETSGNGFVTQIEVRNANTGAFTTVFAGLDPTPPGFNDFVVTFPQTTFPVDAVRITVDTNRTLSQFEAIDAVRLDGIPLSNNDGIYRQTAGRTTVDTTLTVPAGFQLEGGVLEGAGDVIGSVTNTGGTVSPGASPGILDIQGDYTQGPQGRLEIEVAGRDPNVPEFDRLRITGTATLDGTVGVELLNGFQPAPGDQFSVVTSALRLGEFTDYDLPAPGGGGRRLGTAYSGTGLVLQNEVIPPLDWIAATTGAGNNSSTTVEQVVFDAVGNSYVVGSFQGTVDFDREHTVGGDTATSSGQDGFVASYDAQGKLRWLRLLDGSGSASATGVALQASAGGTALVVAGTFNSGITVSGTSVSGTSQNGFLLKLDDAGNLLDLVALPTGVASTAQRVAMLPSGNAVVVGDFQGTMMTSPVTLTSAGQSDAYLLEYAFGTGVVRAARLGGSGDDSGADVAVAPDGGVWMVGRFSDTTTGLAAISSTGGTDAFALKLMPFGTGYTTAVAQSYGDAGDDEAAAIAIGNDGRVHIGGNFRFSVDFDVAAETAFALHSSGDSDAFIVQLASDGSFQWARSVGGYRQDRLSDLTVDSAGHIYVTGEFRDRVDFDPLDGARLLETSSETTPEAFALKLNGSGEHLWSAQVGDLAGAVSLGRGIAVSDDGTVSLIGTFQQTIDVDPTDQVVQRSFTPGNASDTAGYAVLLAQKAAPSVQLVGVPESIVDEGTSIAVGALVSDSDSSFFTYQWSVTRDGTVLATSDEPVVSFVAEQEGLYQIDVTVVDESGNRDSARSQIAARDAWSQLQGTAYGAGTRLLTGNSLGSVDAGDRFGTAISVEGNYVLIGSPGGNEAWLYDPSATTAAAQVKEYLSAPAGVSSSAEFGATVLNLGDWLVVGAPQAATGGRVFVYAFDPSTGPLDGGTQNFSLVHTLTAPEPSGGDRFGAALARLGDLVLIGAPGRSTAAGSSVG
ncbi:MAG TPA: hypothetical protein ENJ16_00755, partial [Planctomycetaceae bacterium]|nr:hypothetical protein [Planctomycetaceae bacterium]